MYSQISAAERATLARIRLWLPLVLAASGAWLLVAFTVLVLMAARGSRAVDGRTVVSEDLAPFTYQYSYPVPDGNYLAMDDQIVVIGSESAASVYVFEMDPETGYPGEPVILNFGNVDDSSWLYASRVAVSGDTIAVTASVLREDSEDIDPRSEAVIIFERSENSEKNRI